jgi:hypothetical protein
VTKRRNPPVRVLQKLEEYDDACRKFGRIRDAMEEVGILSPSKIPDMLGNDWSVAYWTAWVRMWHLWWWLTHHGMTKQDLDERRAALT